MKFHCPLHESLIDRNLIPQWVSYLSSNGLEAVHWSTVSRPETADSEIFDFASTNGWIVFTHDLDFGMLLAALRTNAPSVIKVRYQDVLPSAIGETMLRAIRAGEPYFEVAPSLL